MKFSFGACVSGFVVVAAGVLHSATVRELPVWAYPVAAAAPVSAGVPDATVEHVPGSNAGFTKAQIGDLFLVPDWFPESHAAMPSVVSEGRKPDLSPCAHCHLPNGQGRPENASIAGLPAAYMMEQLRDFKSGRRRSSEARMLSVSLMVGVAKAATPEEMKAGVAYFAAMKLKPWIRVVEADEVPATRIAGGMLMRAEPAGVEPIGERVIEIPEDLDQTELRNATSGFVAYVPVGSLKRGRALARTGGGKTIACVMCHGANLKGVGNVPSIAGRSPSQMTRQIIDIQTGARHGVGALKMKPVVAPLNTADIVAVTGYLASLKP